MCLYLIFFGIGAGIAHANDRNPILGFVAPLVAFLAALVGFVLGGSTAANVMGLLGGALALAAQASLTQAPPVDWDTV